MGRYIYPHEFRWVMKSVRDPYDQRAQSFAIQINTGLRLMNAITIKTTDFRNDLTEVNVPEVKPNVKFLKNPCARCEGKGKTSGLESFGNCSFCDGTGKQMQVTTTIKWRWCPLSPWLTKMIRNRIEYRAMLGKSIGVKDTIPRLFPTLKKSQVMQWWVKNRRRHGKEQPWLLDVWKKFHYFDENKKLIKTKTYYRVSSHSAKAYYCTGAYDVCKFDLVDTLGVTQHEDLKSLQRYTKTFNAIQNKMDLRDRHINSLMEIEVAPFLKGQKRLMDFDL